MRVPPAFLAGVVFPATCPLHGPPFRKEGTEAGCHQCQQEQRHLWRKAQPRGSVWSLQGLLSSLNSRYSVLCYSGKSPRERRKNMRKYHLWVLSIDWLLYSDCGHRLEGSHLGTISRSDSDTICLHKFCIQTILSKTKWLRCSSLPSEKNYTGVHQLYLGWIQIVFTALSQN